MNEAYLAECAAEAERERKRAILFPYATIVRAGWSQWDHWLGFAGRIHRTTLHSILAWPRLSENVARMVAEMVLDVRIAQ